MNVLIWIVSIGKEKCLMEIRLQDLIEQIKKDGVATDLSLHMLNASTCVSLSEDMEQTYKQLHAGLLNQLKCILGEDVDLSEFEYDKLILAEENIKTADATVIVELLGQERELFINMKLFKYKIKKWETRN